MSLATKALSGGEDAKSRLFAALEKRYGASPLDFDASSTAPQEHNDDDAPVSGFEPAEENGHAKENNMPQQKSSTVSNETQEFVIDPETKNLLVGNV